MSGPTTVGELIDRCRSDSTILNLFFKNEHGRWYIPRELASYPTVPELRDNLYLLGLPVESTHRYSDARKGSGYYVYIPDRFDSGRFTNRS